MTNPKANRPTHRPSVRTRPMSHGNAVRELYELVMGCNCPHRRATKTAFKVEIALALKLDMEFHSGGVAPSKVEAEEMVYGKAPVPKDPDGGTKDPAVGVVSAPLAGKFPEVMKVLNKFLN